MPRRERTPKRPADVLKASGVDAAAYHAGLTDEARTRVQDRFASGEARVVCATNAFGMGIDRPDIERVIHARHPRLDRGVLPGDRPGGTRWPAGRRDAALELRRRENPGVPDRSRPGAPEPPGGSIRSGRGRRAGRRSSTRNCGAWWRTRTALAVCERPSFVISATPRPVNRAAPAGTVRVERRPARRIDC